jgi:hypothetical protein
MPDVVGLSLDSKQRATVKRAGRLPSHRPASHRRRHRRLGGQPIISIADVQWVLHYAKDGDTLNAEVRATASPSNSV